MRIFKRNVSLTPGNERSYRMARSLGGMPLDFVRDLEASGNDIANMGHTNIYKFAIQDQTGLSSNVVYLDDIGFVPAGY